MNSGVVKLHLGKLIKEWDFDSNRFFVASRDQANSTANGNGSTGEWVEGDVILAADGVKSRARGAMLRRKGEEDHGKYFHSSRMVRLTSKSVQDTGQAAYRIIVKRSMINEDPELLPFFTGSHSYRWIGEKRHIIVRMFWSTHLKTSAYFPSRRPTLSLPTAFSTCQLPTLTVDSSKPTPGQPLVLKKKCWTCSTTSALGTFNFQTTLFHNELMNFSESKNSYVLFPETLFSSGSSESMPLYPAGSTVTLPWSVTLATLPFLTWLKVRHRLSKTQLFSVSFSARLSPRRRSTRLCSCIR